MIVPYLRGFGTTRFLSDSTFRNGQQSVLGADAVHYNRLDRGGHFAAWEQPYLFADEMRASFRSLR